MRFGRKDMAFLGLCALFLSVIFSIYLLTSGEFAQQTRQLLFDEEAKYLISGRIDRINLTISWSIGAIGFLFFLIREKNFSDLGPGGVLLVTISFGLFLSSCGVGVQYLKRIEFLMVKKQNPLIDIGIFYYDQMQILTLAVGLFAAVALFLLQLLSE